MSEFNAIGVSAENIFRVRTYHKTSVFVDKNLYVIHKIDDKKTDGDRELCVQQTDSSLNFFIVDNNNVKYIRSINDAGKAVMSDERCAFAFTRNAIDDSVSVKQNELYWSAVKNTGNFRLAPKNLAWEYLYLDRIESIVFDKANVILVAFNETFLDKALKRLNVETVNVVAALLNESDDETLAALKEAKKIPIASVDNLERFLISNRDCLWLLCGYNAGADEPNNIAEYILRSGVPRSNIINFIPKMHFDLTWSANLKQAIEGCDFIVLGDIRAAVGFDVGKFTVDINLGDKVLLFGVHCVVKVVFGNLSDNFVVEGCAEHVEDNFIVAGFVALRVHDNVLEIGRYVVGFVFGRIGHVERQIERQIAVTAAQRH